MRTLPLIVLTALLLSACSVSLSEASTPTLTEAPFDTPTLPPTATERPTSTPVTPSATASVIPVEGLVTTQINVRESADRNSISLGLIKAGEKVQIVGQNDAGDWWLIYFTPSPTGYGWVNGMYIQVSATPDVPVIDQATLLAKGTPVPTPTSIAGIASKTVQKVNVRSGPGTGFNSLGTIEPETPLTLTGKNSTGTWLQIYRAGGPDDRGWVSSAYVQVTGDSSLLPVFDETGAPAVETGTLQPERPTPTPVLAPALDDGDSAQKPAVSILFSPQGARQITYSSAVSFPEGDTTDWVQFAPYSPQPGQTVPITLRLLCEGNGTIKVELWQDGAPLPNWGTLACGGASGALALLGDSTYLLKLDAAAGAGGLQSVLYTLTVESGE